FLPAHVHQVFVHLGAVHPGVEDAAFLAARAGQHADSVAFVDIASHRRRALTGFIIRVGVNRQHAITALGAARRRISHTSILFHARRREVTTHRPTAPNRRNWPTLDAEICFYGRIA